MHRGDDCGVGVGGMVSHAGKTSAVKATCTDTRRPLAGFKVLSIYSMNGMYQPDADRVLRQAVFICGPDPCRREDLCWEKP